VWGYILSAVIGILVIGVTVFVIAAITRAVTGYRNPPPTTDSATSAVDEQQTASSAESSAPSTRSAPSS
jgi:hypothetical protein